MADQHLAIPVKSILKKVDSVDSPRHGSGECGRGSPCSQDGHKEMKWDEMNILATHHPEGKTYGHMKIDEPKTPYSHFHDADMDSHLEKMDLDGGETEPKSTSDDPTCKSGINPSSLSARLANEQAHPTGQVKLTRLPSRSDDDDDLDEADMTPEEREKHRQFKQHRKSHYNEFLMMKKAKDLLKQEGLDTMDEVTTNAAGAAGENSNMSH